MQWKSGFVSVLAFYLTACASSGGLPDRIIAQRGGFIPEGIEFDAARSRFLTGSLSEGTIYEITRTGAVRPVITDSALVASVGIEVDEARNRLLVANSDRTNPRGAAMMGAYDLGSGQQLAMVDLTAAIPDRPADANHFANDVAVSPRGVAYVTDTRMNIIYEVDTYYNAAVLHDFGRDSGLGINGIEFHPNGYLLVVSPATGQLIKLSPYNPANWSVVMLDIPATGGDGIFWAADGTLAVVSNNRSRVTKYRSTDNWRSASVVGMASFSGQGTTGAAAGDDVYIIQPHFADQEPPVIIKARF